MDKNTNIISTINGKKVVLMNDAKFKSRRKINWDEIEIYLKSYIGKCFEIDETSEKIYIGKDFPDEFSHSNDTKELKGANMKAKANIVSIIRELIITATDKVMFPDYNHKHKNRAEFGWNRYNTYFGLPIYNENGKLIRYNIFSVRMLVRCDKNGCLYLYDFVRTKKETSKPHKQ